MYSIFVLILLNMAIYFFQEVNEHVFLRENLIAHHSVIEEKLQQKNVHIQKKTKIATTTKKFK